MIMLYVSLSLSLEYWWVVWCCGTCAARWRREQRRACGVERALWARVVCAGVIISIITRLKPIVFFTRATLLIRCWRQTRQDRHSSLEFP